MSRIILGFSLWELPATKPPFLNTGSCLMPKKVSTRHAWTTEHVRTLKTLAKKGDPRCTHCQNPEADRGRNAAKGVQSRTVTRLASLKLGSKVCSATRCPGGVAAMQPSAVPTLDYRHVSRCGNGRWLEKRRPSDARKDPIV